MLLNTQTSYIISSVATTDKTENVKHQSIIIKNEHVLPVKTVIILGHLQKLFIVQHF